MIETARLIGQPFCQEDYAELCQLHKDPRVMAMLGGVRSPETTQTFLADKIAHREKHDFGYWMFRDKELGHFVGRGGIQYVDIEGTSEIEIGYTVRYEAWGKGYATEIAKALLQQTFDELGLDNVVAFTLTTNLGSQRVMQKVGMTYEKEIIHKEEAHVLYRITQKEYKA